MPKLWDKANSPLNMHDNFCVNMYPPVNGTDPVERAEQLLQRQEVILRQMNLNLALLNELQNNTNKVINILLGLAVVAVMIALFGG